MRYPGFYYNSIGSSLPRSNAVRSFSCVTLFNLRISPGYKMDGVHENLVASKINNFLVTDK